MKISLRLKSDFGRLSDFPKEIPKIDNRVTHRLALEAANDMKANLKKNKSQASSLTTNSIHVLKKGNAHYAVGPSVKHGFFIEHGRSPGKAPKRKAIHDWMWMKGIRLPKKQMQQVAFLIARKIAKKGTKPKPFVSPVARDKKWRLAYVKAVQHDIDKFLA